MNTYVIIPAYNEEESLPLVLRDLAKLNPPATEVIVVNNRSVDGTECVAREAGVTVLSEDERGYGAACLCGLNYLFEKEKALAQTIVAFLDGDYSDYPEELTKIVEPIRSGRADFVIGSRLLLPESRLAVPPLSRLGNTIATLFIRFFYAKAFTDLGPFRAIRMDKLSELAMKDRTWGWTIEMQLKAARKNFRTEEVAVRYRTRHAGESKISGSLVGATKASVKILWVLFRHALILR